MLNTIFFKNLKCFEHQILPLAQLTLLTGFNAAGKSTALQSLLMLAQTLRQGAGVNNIILNGPLVRLGSPADVLSENASDTFITIGVQFEQVRVELRLDAREKNSANCLRIMNAVTYQTGEKKLESEKLGEVFLCAEDASRALRELIYISAMRIGTLDVFPAPDTSDPVFADVGAQGEYAPWWFEQRMDEEIEKSRCHPNEPALTLRRQFNAWVGELFPGAESNAQKISKTLLVRLELRTRTTDEWRRPANIGFGLTYAFPILVAGLLAKPGQILVIDSPEAHLHPKGQSKMGEFLAMVAASGVQVMIETHSDHVLNGVRLAVFKKRLSEKDVAIHFFNPKPSVEDDPAQVISPCIDSNGNLSEWPNGFFDQAEKDLAQLAGWI